MGKGEFILGFWLSRPNFKSKLRFEMRARASICNARLLTTQNRNFYSSVEYLLLYEVYKSGVLKVRVITSSFSRTQTNSLEPYTKIYKKFVSICSGTKELKNNIYI